MGIMKRVKNNGMNGTTSPSSPFSPSPVSAPVSGKKFLAK